MFSLMSFMVPFFPSFVPSPPLVFFSFLDVLVLLDSLLNLTSFDDLLSYTFAVIVIRTVIKADHVRVVFFLDVLGVLYVIIDDLEMTIMSLLYRLILDLLFSLTCFFNLDL